MKTKGTRGERGKETSPYLPAFLRTTQERITKRTIFAEIGSCTRASSFQQGIKKLESEEGLKKKKNQLHHVSIKWDGARQLRGGNWINNSIGKRVPRKWEASKFFLGWE